jgi:hypothetical protein
MAFYTRSLRGIFKVWVFTSFLKMQAPGKLHQVLAQNNRCISTDQPGARLQQGPLPVQDLEHKPAYVSYA